MDCAGDILCKPISQISFAVNYINDYRCLSAIFNYVSSHHQIVVGLPQQREKYTCRIKIHGLIVSLLFFVPRSHDGEKGPGVISYFK